MNTGTVAQLAYTQPQAQEVVEQLTAFVAIQKNLAATPSVASVPEFQAQYNAMLGFTMALGEMMPLADPRVEMDKTKVAAVLQRARAWAQAYDAFADVVLAAGGLRDFRQ